MEKIKNLTENRSKSNAKDGEAEEEKKPRPIIKSVTDLQRLKLEKLMKNPDKPVVIPEAPREKDYMQTVPSFVRNVMGSSAGAGSGEFHVYRHLRRKEYARQKCIQAKSVREQLDEDYQMKLERNRLESEAKTAKKRAKRLKKKQRAKKPRSNKGEKEKIEEKPETSEEEDEDENSQKEDSDVEVVQNVQAADNKEEVDIVKEVSNQNDDGVQSDLDQNGPMPAETNESVEKLQIEQTTSCVDTVSHIRESKAQTSN